MKSFLEGVAIFVFNITILVVLVWILGVVIGYISASDLSKSSFFDPIKIGACWAKQDSWLCQHR